jgi:hypothetical protein
MAHTAHATAERLEEIEMTTDEMAAAAAKVAALMKTSKHTVVFTGAGISTSAGVPDFRGPQGVWTLKAQGRGSEIATVPLSCAVPTATHS